MQDSVGGVKGRGPIRYSRVSGGQGVFRQKRSQFSRISPYGKVRAGANEVWDHDLFDESLDDDVDMAAPALDQPLGQPVRRSRNDTVVHTRSVVGVGRPGPVFGRLGARVATGVQEGTAVIVNGLDFNVSEDDIRQLFYKVGPLLRSSLIYDERSGRATGSAEVVFRQPEDAEAAIARYNNVTLDGKVIPNISRNKNAPVTQRPVRVLVRRGGMVGGARRGGRTQFRGIPRRTRGGGRGGARGGGRGGGRSKNATVPTAEDLDKEMDDFLAAPAAQ